MGDPTTHLPVDEAWAMFLEMLQASREFLPRLEDVVGARQVRSRKEHT